MSFFGPIQARDELDPGPRRLPPWMGPPGDWLGATSVEPIILARAGDVVVGLQSVVAYPVGCLLQVVAHARRVPGQPVDDWWSVHDLITGHVGYRREGSEDPGRVLRIGVQFRDGRVATNLEQPPLFGGHDAAAEAVGGLDPHGPILFERGGGGGGGEWEASASRDAWLWPLPPAEWFDIVVEWPAIGLAATSTPVDGARVAAAAALARPLWPAA